MKDQEHLKEIQNKFYLNNPDKKREYQKRYEEKNKEKIALKKKEYREKNKTKIQIKINEYRKHRKTIDPVFKLKNSIRRNINNAFKRKSFSKNSKSEEILGCTFQQFKEHLESQFEPWMTWDNYGLYNGQFKYGWDIDHIIPVITALTESETIILNHHNNLRPLCSKINRDIKKSNLNTP